MRVDHCDEFVRECARRRTIEIGIHQEAPRPSDWSRRHATSRTCRAAVDTGLLSDRAEHREVPRTSVSSVDPLDPLRPRSSTGRASCSRVNTRRGPLSVALWSQSGINSGLTRQPISRQSRVITQSHLRDLNSRPTVYEGVPCAYDPDGLEAKNPNCTPSSEGDRKELAQRLIVAQATGSAEADALAVDLAEATLRSEENGLAREILADTVQGASRALELASMILGCAPMDLGRAVGPK